MEKLVPLPEDDEPPMAVHEKLYGEVPPVAEAVQATAVPTVPAAGQLIVAARARGLIETVAELDAVWVAESVTVTLIVNDPLTE